MAKIKIEQPTPQKLKDLGVSSWSPWSCEPSVFDWEYGAEEAAYVLEGRARIKTAEQEVEIKKGDLVTFPKGLCCKWHILERINKVYTFR